MESMKLKETNGDRGKIQEINDQVQNFYDEKCEEIEY